MPSQPYTTISLEICLRGFWNKSGKGLHTILTFEKLNLFGWKIIFLRLN